jgi:hypothetical protein
MKTGKAYMDDFLDSKGMLRLADLKKGQKFYDMDYSDDNVYELLSLTVVQDDEDTIEYQRKNISTKKIENIRLYGQGVVKRTLVCKYYGRDRGSFISGFKAAMRNYQKYMQVFDMENAGLDNPYNSWMTMNTEYRKWKD